MTIDWDFPEVALQPESGIDAIAHVIQLSVAPVFLFGGVSAMLGVLSARLARIIDRARLLEGRLDTQPEERHDALHRELRILAKRARLVNRAIRLCTTCALMLCAVVIALFAGAFFRLDVSPVIGIVFIAGLTSLGIGLLIFLHEINLATRHLRIGVE